MNFRSVLSREYSHEEVLSLLRITNGLTLLIYYVFVLFPEWSNFFGSGGFVNPDAFAFYPKSWIFSIWHMETLKFLLFVFSILMCVTYTLGIFAKISLILFLPFHIGLHLAAPLIIHEPQQLTNLLAVVLLFLPIENAYSLKKGRDLFRPLKENHLRLILFSMLSYLGLYYFFAGVKKIPDPNWIRGTAVGHLATWPFLAQDNFINRFVRIGPVSFICSWLALIYESGFIFLAFSKWRRWLIPVGILFHASISLILDVGMFFWAMIQWYPLLLLCIRRKN